jgi:hypothetical protein
MSVQNVIEAGISAERMTARNFMLATLTEFCHTLNANTFADELATCITATAERYTDPQEVLDRLIERLAVR